MISSSILLYLPLYIYRVARIVDVRNFGTVTLCKYILVVRRQLKTPKYRNTQKCEVSFTALLDKQRGMHGNECDASVLWWTL